MVLPAAFSYSASLIDTAAKAKSAGMKGVPQVETANSVGKLIKQLQTQRAALEKLVAKADHMHDDLVTQAQLLTGAVADAMASTRAACDALEVVVDDECWPLPKYREMLFPV